jgi:hypothetical protein
MSSAFEPVYQYAGQSHIALAPTAQAQGLIGRQVLVAHRHEQLGGGDLRYKFFAVGWIHQVPQLLWLGCNPQDSLEEGDKTADIKAVKSRVLV